MITPEQAKSRIEAIEAELEAATMRAKLARPGEYTDYWGSYINAHESADALLCEIAEQCGFEEVVSIYNQIPKDYA